MIEFDEFLYEKTGFDALSLKLQYEFQVPADSIPFDKGGSQLSAFGDVDDTAMFIQSVLIKYGIVQDFYVNAGRLYLAEANISVDLGTTVES